MAVPSDTDTPYETNLYQHIAPALRWHCPSRSRRQYCSYPTRLLNDKIEGIEREAVQQQGYRVQVYSGNRQQTAKAEAFRIEKLIQESGLGVETYVLYNPPFWKVRLGNFRTQAEAQQLRDEVVRLLPSLQGDTYVVRDQIQIIQ